MLTLCVIFFLSSFSVRMKCARALPRSHLCVSTCMRACSILSDHTVTDINPILWCTYAYHLLQMAEPFACMHHIHTHTSGEMNMEKRCEMKNPSVQIQFPHRQNENSGKVNKFNWQPWKVDLWLMRKGSRKRMLQSIINLWRNVWGGAHLSVHVWFCGMNQRNGIGLCDPKKTSIER